MKLLTLTGAAVTLLMSVDYWRGAGRLKFEFPVLVLLATTGMMMMISANDLIALYVGLELQSLALYVVAAFDRRSARSSEAGLKYFVLGALSSGMLLYGASLIYGFTGSTLFADIAAAVQPSGTNLGLIFGLVFLMAGFAFKISAVPFHMWTPDVYEGAPTPVTAFFAAAPKLAAMALTVRTLFAAFPAVTQEWQQIVTFLAIASMALGAFAAIGQRNIKRLMAYSSIGHMGYALVGLAAGTVEGVQGVIIYLAIYLAMTLGTFACILAMRRKGRMVEDIDQLAGLSTTSPLMAFLLAMLLFSLAGIPPLAGFFAKFYVFLAAIHAGLYALAVIGVLLERGGRLLLSPHRQDHVFRRSCRAVRADARAACRRSRSERPVHPVLFPLSGTACDCRGGRGEISVLMPAFRFIIAETPQRIPAAPARDRRFHQCRGAPPRRGGRARASMDLVRSAIGGTRPQRPPMAVPARQSLCEPPDRPQLPARHRGQLALLAGVAAYDTAAKLLPEEARSELLLKWPNDVLLKGGKVAGMLLESASETAPNRCKVVIGTGINLATYPADLPQPATSLAAHGGAATPAAAFETLAAVTDAWLTRWGEGVSFQTVRRAWLDRAGPTGRPLRVRLHGERKPKAPLPGSIPGARSGS